MDDNPPIAIECLACSSIRVVPGTDVESTGACECCGYVGWTYAADLDWATRQMIMNGMFARPQEHAAPSVAAARNSTFTPQLRWG